MKYFRDRAYCVRGGFTCANTECDRYADLATVKQADKANQMIGWADLMTSKCGYQPKEETTNDAQ